MLKLSVSVLHARKVYWQTIGHTINLSNFRMIKPNKLESVKKWNTKKVTYEPARLQIFFKLRDKTNSEKERERDGKLGLLWEWVLVVCVGDSRTGGLCWAHGWSHPGSHVFGPRRPWGSHQVWSSSGSFTRRYCFSVSHSFFSYF